MNRGSRFPHKGATLILILYTVSILVIKKKNDKDIDGVRKALRFLDNIESQGFDVSYIRGKLKLADDLGMYD